MNFFDLHCDTLFKAEQENKSLYNNDFHISLEKAKCFKNYIECFAVWIPDEYRGGKAMDLFNRCIMRINNEHIANHLKIYKNKNDLNIQKNNLNGAIITVEGGAVLGGNINNIMHLATNGVKIMSLTWNGNCEIGDGCQVNNAKGITSFGKEVVKKMEDCGIIIDVSHASKNLFYDVCEISKKPFIASHSNSHKICPHKRNLTDNQFKEIKIRGGIVGITFCEEFLNSNKKAGFDDILKHIEHFWELGGENTVSFGSDFDGADVPDELDSLEKIQNLYEYFLKKNFKEKLIQKLFFDNAYNFITKHIK